MTRREEIEQAAMQIGGVHPDWDALECFRVGYKEGAKWADKTMIDKAINWLKENANNYIVDIGGRWECKTIVGGMCWVDLRKYLEE